MKKIRKGKKGFTFVELLAVIAIIGILTTVTVVSVNSLLASSRRKYYQSQENTTVLAGKEYFTDYRSELPKNVGEKEAVTVDTLYTKKYLSELKDHNGNSCTNIGNSKVYSQKITANEYQYYSEIECNGYSVDDDTKAPVIAFSPDKKITNGNITVTMTVTDNSGVASYYYEIEKDNVLYRKEEAKKYTAPVNITFTEEGTYVIKAHAIDTKGNITDKTSNKYIIDRTAPDCSKFNFKSNTRERTWQNQDVKIKIISHSDIAKWSFRNCFYQSNGSGICKDDGKSITGNSTKTLAGAKGSVFTGSNYTDNGHVYGKVIAYDEAGNSCSVNTSEYYIDKDAPVIKSKSITSRNSNYNSLYVTIKLTLTDRIDTTNNKIYYSFSNDNKSYSSWYSYTVGSSSISASWTLSGSYDGKSRKVYIKVKDDLGNTRTETLNYTVYNECSKTYSSTITGSCSANTGFGTATETKKFYDKFTNNYCTSSTSSVKCCINPAIYYGSWSSCSASCGGGTKTRSVTTYKCDGTTSYSSESASCNTQSCQPPRCSSIYYRDGSTCSNSCGSGTYNRLAYDSYDDSRCYSDDLSYGGSSCYSSSGCASTTCTNVYYRDGSTCSNSCGSGTYNQLAYDSSTGERCYSKDKSSGGSYCSSSSGCSTPTPSTPSKPTDTTPPDCPTVKADTASSTWTNKDAVNFTIKFSKDTAKWVWYTYNDTNGEWKRWDTYTGHATAHMSVTGQGSRKVKTVVYDEAGNKKSCVANGVWGIDRTPPSVTITDYTNYKGRQCIDNVNRRYGHRYNVRMTDDKYSGLQSTSCQWDRGPTNRGYSGFNVIVENLCQDKTGGIKCKACDVAGNCTTKTK